MDQVRGVTASDCVPAPVKAGGNDFTIGMVVRSISGDWYASTGRSTNREWSNGQDWQRAGTTRESAVQYLRNQVGF